MTIDIGRQGNFTALIEEGFDRLRIPAIQRKLHNPATGGMVFSEHLERDCGPMNREQIAWTHPLRRASQTKPAPLSLGLQHQKFRETTTSTPDRQPRFEHPGVVHHEQITGLQLLQQIPHLAVSCFR